MTIDLARAKVRHSAYQWRMPVLDCAGPALRVGWWCSAGRTRSTWRANRTGSIPLEVHHPEGQTESKIG